LADTLDETGGVARPARDAPGPALVVAWCAEAGRVGEVVAIERGPGDGPRVFGRGEPSLDDALPRATLVRQRPGVVEPRPPVELPALSRAQLEIARVPGGLSVANVGRRALLDGAGAPVTELVLRPGDVCEIKGQLVLVCALRPSAIPRLRSLPGLPRFAFGSADEQGLVGESPAVWAIRDQCAFVAGRAAHVLVLGESGTGKEVVAQAIHALSRRARRPLVARSAATIPSGLADAELFGNLANYPNPGTPERKGLVGEADGSTLFLDELGELPEELQARLLRVLDDRGEYHRLGEAKVRRADLRLIAATNRPVSALKLDVAARFRLRLTLPGLDARVEDVPLLARELLARIARGDPEIGARFFEGWDGRDGEPRIAPALVRALVRTRYRTHVRELDALLWRSLVTSEGEVLELTDDMRGELDAPPVSAAAPEVSKPRRDVGELTLEEVRGALERAEGVQERAWRELGLANRYVLKRLVKKWGLAAARDD
jgi:two-component system nitrogen regulation response regulator GlnG/two-component system response regulator HydG